MTHFISATCRWISLLTGSCLATVAIRIRHARSALVVMKTASMRCAMFSNCQWITAGGPLLGSCDIIEGQWITANSISFKTESWKFSNSSTFVNHIRGSCPGDFWSVIKVWLTLIWTMCLEIYASYNFTATFPDKMYGDDVVRSLFVESMFSQLIPVI
jgi:hypothetical protein